MHTVFGACLSNWRLAQHHMMLCDVCDVLELVLTGAESRYWPFDTLSTFGVGWLRSVNGVVHSSGVTALSVP